MTNKLSPFRDNFQLPGSFLSAKSATDSEPLTFGGFGLPPDTIYLDYASSTPIHIDAYRIKEKYELSYFGNPAARLHPMGALSEFALAQAREDLAQMLSVKFEEVLFLASATEANNFILRGLVESPRRKRHKIVVGATEHSSVLTTALALQKSYGRTHQISVEVLAVDTLGQVDLDDARRQIDDSTLCLCVMDVNNETGVAQKSLPQLIEIAHAKGVHVHVDAVQGFARGAFSTSMLDYDSLVISSGKIYGPKGAASLVLRKQFVRAPIEAQLTGGGHEFNMRSSTSNLAAIVGFAFAAQLQQKERATRNAYLAQLESHFLSCLKGAVDFKLYGESTARVPGICMLSIEGVNSMKLVENMANVCVSVGSACRTLQATASHVLLAMGVPLEEALSSIRVSFGLPNSLDEASTAAERVAQAAKALLSKPS